MALPSQTERSSSSSRVSASRSRGMSSRMVATITTAIVLVAVAGGVVYFKYLPSGSPATTSAKPSPQDESNAGAKPLPPLNTPAASSPPVKPPAELGGSTPPVKPLEPAPTPPSGGTASPANTPAVPSPADLSTGSKPAPVDLSNPGATPAPKTGSEQIDARPAGPTSTLPASGSTEDVRKLIAQGDDARQKGQLVQARQVYSRALINASTARSDQDDLRTKLTAINDELVFSPKVTAGDPLTEIYSIQSGDAIARLPRKRELAIDWRLIKRVNNLSEDDLSRLKIGQKIKLVRGPFHAVVSKADYRLDIFAGSPDEPESWIYIRSFKVGLGEGNATPVGSFIIKSRQVNPPWTNPKTGEKFAADDPQNPIGEYWLGWEGVGPSAAYKGFGIHGTIDPDSVGKQKSMGCVRLLNEDVGMVYEMLTERISVVQVRP